jgi:stearoyl-CoA desaturase (delta-9 desaturase)
MLYGLLNLSFWGYVIALFIMTQLTIFSVTVYLHRHQAHRALELHPVVSHFFRFWLWLTTGMRTIEWVAVHRKHHAYTEQEQDPHSPQQAGLSNVLLRGVELYRAAAQDKAMLEKYGYGTPDDWIERRIYSRSFKGVFLMLVIDLVLFGVPGITIWALQMLWIPFFGAGVINGIGHYFGYRNFESPDASRNIVPWAVFIGGEELHNNHHAFASSAKLSVRPWEVDSGWGVIRLLSWFGLAKVNRVAPRLIEQSTKNTVDMDTLKAVLSNRLSIMSVYAKDVIQPIWHKQFVKADRQQQGLLRKAKKWLIRDEILLSSNHKKGLSELLTQYQQLQQIYDFRQKLQTLWQEKKASPAQQLAALQEWCQSAEQTGITVLQEFALKMKRFVSSGTVAI